MKGVWQEAHPATSRGLHLWYPDEGDLRSIWLQENSFFSGMLSALGSLHLRCPKPNNLACCDFSYRYITDDAVHVCNAHEF